METENEMNIKKSKVKRRTNVLLNYSSLILFLIFYYTGLEQGWNAVIMAVGIAVLLAAVVVTSIITQITTGLWRLTHSGIDNLDERQIVVVHEALRRSYSVFAILCLVIMIFNAVTGSHGNYLFDIVLPISLLYFAHSLPASVLAWTEKEV